MQIMMYVLARTHGSSPYPWRLMTRIASRIERDRESEVHQLVDQYLDRVELDHPRRLATRKLRCGALLSHCLRAAHRGGASSDSILKDHSTAIELLSTQRSWRTVRREIHVYVQSLLACMRVQHHTDMERVVNAIRRDLRAAPQRRRTLSEYARAAGVSPEHLSRTFHAKTGVTFREECRRLRIEQAIKMLTRTSMKVSAIARRVGQRDTSRFIQDFRRETGITPGVYRTITNHQLLR